ncbi:prephenate dehydratase [Candidatus Woesearchaeota archaeon]|nr:prephenate dehydratase [Candidatus Woesearchaeota archaeon]
MNIAYQGIKGSYSEGAVSNYFGDTYKGTRLKANGYESFEDVFEAVIKKKADAGVIPVENSITGGITRNYDLLLKENVVVIGEVFLPIQHHLLATEGSSLQKIKVVYSHPQALEQCRDFLRKHALKATPEYDTAGAAKMIKERNRPDQGAIAAKQCSAMYGLQILAEDIGTVKHNITRFFVFVRPENIPRECKQEKTSIAFKTKHRPGALVNCLQRLAKNGINLTKLESRPIPENPWEYVFYADFEGGLHDPNVKLTLNEMEASSLMIKILGSYPKGTKTKDIYN